MALVVGEYGKALILGTGLSLAGATTLALTIVRPDGTTFGGAPTVGAVARTVTIDGASVVLAAGEWVEYLLQPGDLTTTGLHRVRLQVDFGAPTRLKIVETTVVVQPG